MESLQHRRPWGHTNVLLQMEEEKRDILVIPFVTTLSPVRDNVVTCHLYVTMSSPVLP
jgi:hypothetical protein